MSHRQTESESRQMNTRHNVRVNARLGLILFVALTVSGTAIHFLHGFMVGRNATNLLDRAERLLTEAEQAKTTAQTTEDATERGKLIKENSQKLGDAVKYFQRYVQLKPDDYDAWVKLALTSDKVITNYNQL